MNIGLVGYKKPEIESLLQAYAVKAFLKDYNIDCFLTEEYKINSEDSKSLIEFAKDEIGYAKKADVSTFLMINYKSFVSIYDTEAAFRDFYQRSFGMKEVIMEALLLLQKEDYDALAVKKETLKRYMVLDSYSDRSNLVPMAQKYAKTHNLELISMVDDKKYDKLKTTKITNPREYIALIQNAEFVVTDSFMSMYMALLYKKPFFVQDAPILPGKLKRFLKRINLMSHYIIKDDVDYGKEYEIADKKELEALLHQLRNEASNYLFECLPPVVKDCEVDAPPKIMRSECNGCFACKEICPVNAITMVKDREGFYYPQVNDNCTNCNLCVTACIKKEKTQTVTYEEDYPKAYCALSKFDDQRQKATSGGVFPLIAEYAINQKHGAVVGAAYDEDLNVIPTLATDLKQVDAFYGMKYVKAELDGVYPKVKKALEEQKFVVYTGLPCECAGLKAYLQKDYENLFIIDRLCHSAPSPKVFQKYVDYIGMKYESKVTNVRFREKSRGWLIHKMGIVFEFADRKPIIVNARRNNYFRNYMQDNISMPSCAKCNYLVRNRVGDITLGDFWGIDKIDKAMFDNKGASLVLVNTQKGAEMLAAIKENLRIKPMTMGQAFKYNYKRPMELTKERSKIFECIDLESIDNLLEAYNDLK